MTKEEVLAAAGFPNTPEGIAAFYDTYGSRKVWEQAQQMAQGDNMNQYQPGGNFLKKALQTINPVGGMKAVRKAYPGLSKKAYEAINNSHSPILNQFAYPAMGAISPVMYHTIAGDQYNEENADDLMKEMAIGAGAGFIGGTALRNKGVMNQTKKNLSYYQSYDAHLENLKRETEQSAKLLKDITNLEALGKNKYGDPDHATFLQNWNTYKIKPKAAPQTTPPTNTKAYGGIQDLTQSTFGNSIMLAHGGQPCYDCGGSHMQGGGGFMDDGSYPMMNYGGDDIMNIYKEIAASRKKARGGDTTVQGGDQDFLTERNTYVKNLLADNAFAVRNKEVRDEFMNMPRASFGYSNPDVDALRSSYFADKTNRNNAQYANNQNFIGATTQFANNMAPIIAQNTAMNDIFEGSLGKTSLMKL